VAGELEDIRRGIKAAHKKLLRFLIWAGMGVGPRQAGLPGGRPAEARAGLLCAEESE